MERVRRAAEVVWLVVALLVIFAIGCVMPVYVLIEPAFR